MATYFFSQIQEGAVLTFNPAVDVLYFDRSSGSYASLSTSAAEVKLEVSADGKSYTLTANNYQPDAPNYKTFTLQSAMPWQPGSANFEFANGSKYLSPPNSTALPEKTSSAARASGTLP